MNQPIYLLIAILLLLTTCSFEPPPEPLQRPGYVLSGGNVGDGFRKNRLTIVDPETWQIHHTVRLPRSWAKNFARDPQGRLWIGFSGSFDKNDNRLHVYSPVGELLRETKPCANPEAGISFAGGRAFVACSEDGTQGKVIAISLETLEVEQEIPLMFPNSTLLLISSAASEAGVIVAGLTSGPGETGYSIITIIDPQTLQIRAQLGPEEDVDIWQIIPKDERFYLINVGSWRRPRELANDVLVLDPGRSPTLTPLVSSPSPLWGAIEGDMLYTYHNPTWNQANSDPTRRISRLDLKSGQKETWLLPDEWNASDLAIVDGQIVLTRWGERNEKDGLYTFDAVTGQMFLLVAVPEAGRLMVAPK